MKKTLKAGLSHFGWFLRKSEGLPFGVSLERDWRKIFGRNPKTILDVGAHKGESVDRFLFEFPCCRVFSFEPVSANFAVLTERFAGNRDVECFHMALGAERSRADIRLESDSQTHSLGSRPPGKFGEVACESVLVETLDHFAKEIRVLDSIDLLKIDTEGYEMQVLYGGAELLSSGKIKSILAEATLAIGDHVHTGLSTLQEHLSGKDFELAGIYDQDGSHRLKYFNALFVRQS